MMDMYGPRAIRRERKKGSGRQVSDDQHPIAERAGLPSPANLARVFAESLKKGGYGEAWAYLVHNHKKAINDYKDLIKKMNFGDYFKVLDALQKRENVEKSTEGKHIKYVVSVKDPEGKEHKFSFTFPKTPSDYRSVKNQAKYFVMVLMLAGVSPEDLKEKNF